MGGDREYPSRPVRRPPGHSGAAATTVRGGAYPTMTRMVAQGTRAIDAARRAGIVYAVHEYAHDPRSSLREGGRGYALEAVAALGLDPARVFKTIVVAVDGKLGLAVVPADAEVDLKAVADALGGRRCAIAEAAEAERATGYVLGGISPLGTKRAAADRHRWLGAALTRRCTSRPGVAASRSSCRRTTSRGSPARCWRRSHATAEAQPAISARSVQSDATTRAAISQTATTTIAMSGSSRAPPPPPPAPDVDATTARCRGEREPLEHVGQERPGDALEEEHADPDADARELAPGDGRDREPERRVHRRARASRARTARAAAAACRRRSCRSGRR